MSQALIVCDIDAHGVATLRLNRPEKANGFNIPMIGQCSAAIEALANDDAVKVIVITGTGRFFCAGGDIDELFDVVESGAVRAKAYLWEHIHRIPLALERLDKPVIAAVNGAARGAGMDVALMADIRIAGASASFAQSYVDLGVIPGDGGAWFLPRIAGAARALEMIWTGDVIDAATAERLGIVSRVVPDADLATAASDLAHRLAGQPQHAIRIAKRAVYQGLGIPLAAHLDAMSSHMAVLYESEDFRTRLRAVKARLTKK